MIPLSMHRATAGPRRVHRGVGAAGGTPRLLDVEIRPLGYVGLRGVAAPARAGLRNAPSHVFE